MTSVQRIIVVGGGSIAWLAAAALKQAFRHRELDVLVVDAGPACDTPLGDWTLPSLRAIHALLGIKESDFIRQTGATFKLASEHSGWQSDTQSFMHAHGEIGSDLNGTPFYKYLLLQAVAGRKQGAEDYSLAAVAARLHRFARPMTRTPLTSSFTYGFHLTEAAYCDYVRAHAEKLGVRRKEDACVDVLFAEDSNIAALTLQSGEQIQADYFLDCSGRQAVLMNRLSPADRENWAQWLPNDRMLSLSAPVIGDPPPVTRTIAGRAGWFWRIPLAQSSIAGHVYCSDYVSDDAALEQLKNVTGESCGEPVLSFIAAGRRNQFWNKNCVALGEAAVELEPLVGARLHLAQLGIASFIELFPIGTDSSLEAIEYNRIMGGHADALRDFTIAHYRAGPQKPGEYWARTRAAPLPSRLTDKLDLFRSNGRISLLDNESFEEVDWAWLLLGSGCIPERIELHTQANLERVRPEQCASLRASIAELAASMPRHIDYVRQQS
jgi:tryptophan 7-halogenase